jgi:hypothetical protein
MERKMTMIPVEIKEVDLPAEVVANPIVGNNNGSALPAEGENLTKRKGDVMEQDRPDQ